MSDASGKRRGAARRPKSASDLATTVMACIAIALPLMLYLRQHVEILRTGYEIEALKERRAQLVERSRELEIRKAQATSLPEMERRASALGLVAPDPEDVFVATGDRGEEPAATPGSPPMQARLE